MPLPKAFSSSFTICQAIGLNMSDREKIAILSGILVGGLTSTGVGIGAAMFSKQTFGSSIGGAIVGGKLNLNTIRSNNIL
jgi:hypothetical protein